MLKVKYPYILACIAALTCKTSDFALNIQNMNPPLFYMMITLNTLIHLLRFCNSEAAGSHAVPLTCFVR